MIFQADSDFDALLEQMIEDQLARRKITDQRVLEAMRCVPRHLFVPQEMQHMAYWDGPLSIGEGQTISQPYIVALMTQLLCLTGSEKVLEVGCGSGYQAAVLSCLAEQIITIERHSSLATQARQRLKKLGLDNVLVLVGDGTLGVAAEAPFDAIIITAATPKIPHPLQEQLVIGGRIVAPVGSLGSQVLEVRQQRETGWQIEHSIPVVFVPLIGEHGWEKGERDRDRWYK